MGEGGVLSYTQHGTWHRQGVQYALSRHGGGHHPFTRQGLSGEKTGRALVRVTV